MTDINADLLKHLLRIARNQGRYSAGKDLRHAADYVEPLEDALTDAVDFLKENPDLPSGTPLLATLAVDITYAAGEVMGFLGADNNSDEAFHTALAHLREAGKVDEAEKMETYKGFSDYAIQRLKQG